MSTRYLLDTHVVVRWVSEPRRLSREQARILDEAVDSREPLCVSAMTLLEIAALARATKSRVPVSPRELFDVLRTNDAFAILPITIDIAEEDAALVWAIADPGDRAIVATAGVHGLTLLTSDARIVDSKLVRVVD